MRPQRTFNRPMPPSSRCHVGWALSGGHAPRISPLPRSESASAHHCLSWPVSARYCTSDAQSKRLGQTAQPPAPRSGTSSALRWVGHRAVRGFARSVSRSVQGFREPLRESPRRFLRGNRRYFRAGSDASTVAGAVRLASVRFLAACQAPMKKGNAVKAAPRTSAKRHERTAQAGAPFRGAGLHCFVHQGLCGPG